MMAKRSYLFQKNLVGAAVALSLLIASLFAVYAQTQASLSLAEASIEQSQNTINYLKTIGLSTQRLDDLLLEAKLSLEQRNYGRVISLGNEISSLKDTAINLQQEIAQIKIMLADGKNLSLNVSAAELSLQKSVLEFDIGNYEQATVLLGSTQTNLVLILEEELVAMHKTALELINFTDFREIKLEMLERYAAQTNAKMQSKDLSDLPSFKEKITLAKNSVTALSQAHESISNLKQEGLFSSRFDDLYKEALLSIELENFKRAGESLMQIQELEKKAFSASKSITETKKTVLAFESSGLDLTSSNSLLEQASEALSVGNYEDAQSFSDDALKKAQDSKESSLLFGAISKSQLRFSVASFFKRFWWAMALIILLLALFGSSLYRGVSTRILRQRIRRLQSEKENIISLIKKYQEDYFKKKILSKDSYDSAVDAYQERPLEIKEALPQLESSLEKRSAKK